MTFSALQPIEPVEPKIETNFITYAKIITLELVSKKDKDDSCLD
jgi:hypothetical protein